MTKSADAFRTISEVAEWLGVQTHVLRFWESKFTQVKPVKRAGGRRYYRPSDMLLLGGIRKLLHEDGLTIKGVQKILREEGMAYVADLSPPLDAETDAQLDADLTARMDEDVEPQPVEADVLPFEAPSEPTAASTLADDISEDVEPNPEAPEAEPTDVPLPSFLKTPTPASDTVEPDVDDHPGLPYPPLVEDVLAPEQEDIADKDAPALTEDLSDAEPEEQLSASASDDTSQDDTAAPPETVAEAEAEASESETEQAQAPEDGSGEIKQDAEPVATLPSFLSDYSGTTETEDEPDAAQAQDTEPAAATPSPRIVNVPDDPAPDSIPVSPSALSKTASLTHLSDAQRNMIRPLLAQLTALRDQMVSNRREPR
ncbi:MerR family transcriptional regulator [uncultured Tateyamaria sp.]|uniref:MerR family transcriptional regulator n=1 Tax=uncultured Tateyamaria sp. TaxID=455651 RepID=UPI002635873E|nr:MerR family transcriptional regulator [uncultured Tateyamaria sp.]